MLGRQQVKSLTHHLSLMQHISFTALEKSLGACYHCLQGKCTGETLGLVRARWDCCKVISGRRQKSQTAKRALMGEAAGALLMSAVMARFQTCRFINWEKNQHVIELMGTRNVVVWQCGLVKGNYPHVTLSGPQKWRSTPHAVVIFCLSFGHAKNLGICKATKDSGKMFV